MNDAVEVQGYVPGVKKKGCITILYVAFDGGLTKKFMDAYCVNSPKKAFQIARNWKSSHYDTIAAIPVNGECKLLEKDAILS